METTLDNIKNTPIAEQTAIFRKQKAFFAMRIKTKPYEFRKAQLQKLKALIQRYEERIMKALADDFGKASTRKLRDRGRFYV